MNTLTNNIIQFDLPQYLSCPKPTEDRGLRRDDVRLMVTSPHGPTHHDIFRDLDQHLDAGDVLVINTSAMIAAALPLELPSGEQGMLHLSTKISDREWLVEIRAIHNNKTERWKEGVARMVFDLPNGAHFVLKWRFYKDHQQLDLWIGELQTAQEIESYLEANGKPIKYTQINSPFPLSYYQTYFSFHKGSSEMPSAGRGFTASLMRKLLKKGVVFAPILLHTGVSSLEENEKPYPEYMEIDPVSALQINQAKKAGKKVIAVGTTAIRAIETAADDKGILRPYRGNTELYITHDHQMKITDGLLTGFHEPKASHLNILQSLAGYAHIDRAYQEAIHSNYFWHQFGDLHLILS